MNTIAHLKTGRRTVTQQFAPTAPTGRKVADSGRSMVKVTGLHDSLTEPRGKPDDTQPEPHVLSHHLTCRLATSWSETSTTSLDNKIKG